MDPEDKITQQTWGILQDIKEDFLAQGKKKIVKYRLLNTSETRKIPLTRIRDIIYSLEKEKAFRVHRREDSVRWGTGDIFYLIIKKSAFYKIYERYKNNGQIEIRSSVKLDTKIEWQGNFRWEGNKFIFGDYGEIEFRGIRKKLFIKLADKQGDWVDITLLEEIGGENARTILGQIAKRLEKYCKGCLTVKPSAEGSYRIVFTPNLYKG